MKDLKKILFLFLFLVLVSACASSSNDEYDTLEEGNVANEEIAVGDRVYFGLNKYNLSPSAKKILDVQSEWLKSEEQINIIIEGRCDERGTREYNLALGERRANSVREYLVKKGISSKRIKTISYGKEKPVVEGSNEEAWAKNRVAITVQEIE